MKKNFWRLVIKLDIVIPSLNRREKLQNCINSILRGAISPDINLIVYLGTQPDVEYFKNLLPDIENIKIRFLPEYKVPQFWNSYLADMKADALCYMNDDVEVFDDTLKVILEEFPKQFPDTDGILGLNQANITDSHKCQSAFGVIGTKYADRFPNRQVWCPDYHRFYADWELWKRAKDINKFFYCEWAMINHFHPSLNSKWEDATHYDVRTYLKQDKQTFQKRQALNLLWGTNYQLINL